jgi:hypothetical protein
MFVVVLGLRIGISRFVSSSTALNPKFEKEAGR